MLNEKKIRFSFNTEVHVLAEELTYFDSPIVMYFEKSRELCPHCKEEIVKGEHHTIELVEIWIPISKTPEQCELKNLVIVGKTTEVSLLLNKECLAKALEQSKIFNKLVPKG